MPIRSSFHLRNPQTCLAYYYHRRTGQACVPKKSARRMGMDMKFLTMGARTPAGRARRPDPTAPREPCVLMYDSPLRRKMRAGRPRSQRRRLRQATRAEHADRHRGPPHISTFRQTQQARVRPGRHTRACDGAESGSRTRKEISLHQALNLARLPIPPSRRAGAKVSPKQEKSPQHCRSL